MSWSVTDPQTTVSDRSWSSPDAQLFDNKPSPSLPRSCCVYVPRWVIASWASWHGSSLKSHLKHDAARSAFCLEKSLLIQKAAQKAEILINPNVLYYYELNFCKREVSGSALDYSPRFTAETKMFWLLWLPNVKVLCRIEYNT